MTSHHPQVKTAEETAQDVVLKWTSDKNVSIRPHGGITHGNNILLIDCIREAIEAERLALAKVIEENKKYRDLSDLEFQQVCFLNGVSPECCKILLAWV